MRIRESRWRIEEWLDAVSEGYTPGGKPTLAIRVRPGVLVEMKLGVGDGDDPPALRYAGRRPEYEGGSESGETVFFRFPASPSILYEYPEGPDRTDRLVYVCATEAHIRLAQAGMRFRRRVDDMVEAACRV